MYWVRVPCPWERTHTLLYETKAGTYSPMALRAAMLFDPKNWSGSVAREVLLTRQNQDVDGFSSILDASMSIL